MEWPWLIPTVSVVVVAHLSWTGWCCWKAKKAYLAAEKLFEWVNAVHDPLMCAIKKTECEPGSGGWPPKKVGAFPPKDE